jgi:hypothetical protein
MSPGFDGRLAPRVRQRMSIRFVERQQAGQRRD